MGCGDSMSAKTNAIRLVEKAGIPYLEKFYEYSEEDLSGNHAAQVLGLPEEQVFKTLVARGERTGINVFCIPVCCELDLKKAAKAAGDKNMELIHVKELLDKSPMKPIVFEQEFFPEDVLVNENLPFTVERSEEDPEVFLVEGPKIEKMLGYTNLDSEKGFAFFQKFLKQNGILDELEKAGISEGDTVRMYGLAFEYYK